MLGWSQVSEDSKFTSIPGKNFQCSSFPQSLLAVGVSQLHENSVALGEAKEKRDPKGWELGFGFVGGFLLFFNLDCIKDSR